MAFVNYTDYVGHGASLGAAAPLTPYTDPTGEVWVAKGGVNGGAWKKARDVLHCSYYRNTAWTTGTSSTAFITANSGGFDTVVSDPYTIYTQAAGITIPVAGLWHFDIALGIATATANAWLAVSLRDALGNFVWAQNTIGSGTTATGLIANVSFSRPCLVNDVYRPYQSASAAIAGGTGVGFRISADYLGTG